jgi:hypothetical protein
MESWLAGDRELIMQYGLNQRGFQHDLVEDMNDQFIFNII